jgi:hypothetical protein
VKIKLLTKSYLTSEDHSLAANAHELLGEVDEVTSRGQKQIHRLLWRLGLLPEGSEMSSLENKDAGPNGPQPPQARAPRGEFSFR